MQVRDKKYLAATLIGSFVLLSCQLLFPLSIDNEIFQSMAMDLYRFHQIPYIGSWAHDFPGTVYVHWVSIILFGDSALGFRTFDLLMHLSMSWMLFVILRNWLPARSACFAVLFYNLHYISNFWFAGQRDAFAMFFLLLGTVLLLELASEREKKGRILLLVVFTAGVALAMMMTLRLTYAPFVFVGLGYLIAQAKEGLRLAAVYLAGVCLVLAALVVPYLFYPGGLEQAYLTTIRYNLDIYGIVRLPRMLFHQLRIQKVFFVSGFAGLCLAFIPSLRQSGVIRNVWSQFQRPQLRDLLLIIGYALCGIISIWAMGKFWPYHFEPVLLIFVPFGAVAIETAIIALPWKSLRWAVGLVLIAYVVARVYPGFLVGPYLTNIVRGVSHPLEAAQDSLLTDPGHPRSMDMAVASYIDQKAPRGARFESAAITAAVRWHTPRMSATRFTTLNPIIVTSPDGSHPAFQQAWRREYVDSLNSAKPYFISVSDQPIEVFGWIHKSPLQAIHEIPGFDSLIMPHYRQDTTIGGYTILKRID